jgi:hypothetical protein
MLVPERSEQLAALRQMLLGIPALGPRTASRPGA